MTLLGQLTRSCARARRAGACAFQLQSAWRMIDAQPASLAAGHCLSQAARLAAAAAAGGDSSGHSQAGRGKWGGGTKHGKPEQPARSTQEERLFRLAGRFKVCPLPWLPSPPLLP